MEKTHNLNALTVGELVARDYRKADVFKKYGIDFCCGGKKTLTEICKQKKINIDELNVAFEELNKSQNTNTPDYNNWDLCSLTDHIVNTHHSYVRESLPILLEYSIKVAKVHGEANPEVVEIALHLEVTAKELQMHMHKEETILFPYIERLYVAEQTKLSMPAPLFGTIRNPIQMMEAEHNSAGNALENIRHLSNNYTTPAHACNTYRVLYAKLKEFEEDLHQHIHLENNILFPKATALEKELII